MDLPQTDLKQDKRLENYQREVGDISLKLENPDVPPGKKEKLRYRLTVVLNQLPSNV